MKITFTLLFLFCTLGMMAQDESSAIEINTEYYDAVDHWVALQDSDTSYFYGFIYVDEGAGFTFDWGGKILYLDNDYSLSKTDTVQTSVKIRIESNWKTVGVIPTKILEALDIPETPDWLSIYKENEEEVSYKVAMGYHFNHVGASKQALGFLEEAYEMDSHYKGLEFELAYAYNATEQFEKAVVVLGKAIENNHKDFYLYRELGFSYKFLNKVKEAEKTYKKGIKMSGDNFEKSEMAVNMAHTYYELKNKEKFEEWAEITKKYAEKDSRYAQMIDYMKANFKE